MAKLSDWMYWASLLQRIPERDMITAFKYEKELNLFVTSMAMVEKLRNRGWNWREGYVRLQKPLSGGIFKNTLETLYQEGKETP